MKNRILIIILIFFVISCKNNIPYPTHNSIVSYYKKEFDNNTIMSDPIIVEDNKLIGLYSSIDTDSFKYKFIHYSSIRVLPKGYTYLNDYFGENAENGIIIINRYNFLRCGEYSLKRIFLIDNKETTLEKLIKNKTKCYFIARFEGLKDKNGVYIEITILTSKKPEQQKL